MSKTESEIEREYLQARKLIDRLWSTYTPAHEIRRLYHELTIATENERRKLRRAP